MKKIIFMRKIIFLLILWVCFIPLYGASAKDTDIYVLDQSTAQVPPDVLIMLDLSGSMEWNAAGEFMYIDNTVNCINSKDSYSWCKTHHCSQNCPSGTAYYLSPAEGRTNLCRVWDVIPYYSDTSCTGAFYVTSKPGYTTNCIRLEIAKRAIFHILDADESGGVTDPQDQEALDMRLGYMRFWNCGSDTGTNYSSDCSKLIDGFTNADGTTKSYATIWSHVNAETFGGKTYVVNMLKEGKLYLDYHKGQDVAKNCRKKYAILITDGQETMCCSGPDNEWAGDQYKRRRETVARVKALANAGYLVFVVGFGADMPYYLKNTLSWAAYYGGTDNLRVTNSGSLSDYPIPYGQIYPTGVVECQIATKTACYLYSDLIQGKKTSCTAGNTGCYCYAADTNKKPLNDPGEATLDGYAFFAENPEQLNQAIEDIRDYIINILEKSTSYVAPVVPISQMEKTGSGNRMYLGMFKPQTTSFWNGNIKKFGIGTENTADYNIGDIIDASTPAQRVTDAWNRIKDGSMSYWSATADGGEVEKGGVGAMLQARNLSSNSRKIYTYLTGNSTDLTHTSNAFSLSNTAVTPTVLGLLAGDTVGRNQVIDFAHGYDAYDGNRNGDTTEKRDWILGAFIHSRPVVLYYPSPSQHDKTVIYVGGNDGMLHAFDDSTGEEMWAFIPPNLLPNLKDFKTELSLLFFVDGSLRAYQDSDKTILVFGERRGGNRYYALDVTNPDSPTLLWEISPNRTGYGELGQTWSAPKIGKIKDGAGAKWIVYFGGGYDTNQDKDAPDSIQEKGSAVYIADLLTGDLVWKFTSDNSSSMKNCIPGDVNSIDINGDGFVDRLYVGDTGGRIWRFDIGDVANKGSWTGKLIFESPAGLKIFYPPDVVLERDSGGDYEILLFGTGDREHPKGTTEVNRIYAIKDKNPSTSIKESTLTEMTDCLLQDPNATQEQEQARLNALSSSNGWFIQLSSNGEKVLAEALTFGGAVYCSTFSPTVIVSEDPCQIGEGTGKIYVLKYKTGNAVFNLDYTNDVGGEVIKKEDRSLFVGTGIPSGVIIAVFGGKVVGYSGVAGGIYSPQLSTTNPLIPMTWRIIF